MPVKTMQQLQDEIPIPEVDDYEAGFMMAVEISGARPEYIALCLARWAARLREHYVQIGRENLLNEEASGIHDGALD